MELTVLKDIVIIFSLSTVVNFFFTKIRIPTVIGYLLTGVLAGPYVLKLIHSAHEIELMAEIGVVLLLFTIGMEFSLKHLYRIRRIVFLGGFIQVFVTAGVFYVASHFYGMSWKGGLFMGFLSALSSSALVLKLLQERSEISSTYGRTVLGILIFQDLMLVPLILFTSMLGDTGEDMTRQFLVMTVKVVLILAFVYVGNKWLFPKLLHLIALAKNQELFMMSIFVICLAIALLTSELGLSLAFGAFLAGLMISESEYSHNAFGNLIPFKDTFTSFFFVSIGMLLDLNFVFENWQIVVVSILLVLVLKTIIAGGTGFLMGHTFRGTVLVGLALSQVGEFSFILAKIGLSYELISTYHYQLFLAVAVITMSVTPFFMQFGNPLATTLLKLPLPQFWVEGLFPLKEIKIPKLHNHLVIIGKDTSALKLAVMAKYIHLPYVSVIFDPALVRERQQQGENVIYGDAVNTPILEKAHISEADLVVVSVGNIIPAMAIIEKVRMMNKNAYVIVRAKQIQDMEQLYHLGADQVFPEKLEIAMDLFSRVLSKRLVNKKEINKILGDIRNDYYGIFLEKDVKHKPSILDELADIDISAIKIDEQTPVINQTLRDIKLRSETGVTLFAVKRGNRIIEHPGPDFKFVADDIVYVMGKPDQIMHAEDMFTTD